MSIQRSNLPPHRNKPAPAPNFVGRRIPVGEDSTPLRPDAAAARRDSFTPREEQEVDCGYGYRRTDHRDTHRETAHQLPLPGDREEETPGDICAQPCEPPSQSAQTSTQADTGRYKLTVTYTSIRFGYASGSYSKNDALLDSLRETYGDEAAIHMAGGSLSTLSGQQLAALEQEMQHSGRSAVMWGSYTQITIEMSFHSMEELEGALGRSLDILCAARQAQGSILPRHYAGEELAGQTARMDELFRESLARINDLFMDYVGGFLDRHGAIGQSRKIGMSVQSLFAQYQSKYEAIAAANTDPTGTGGTRDAWLGSHFGYLTASLLQLGKGIEVPTEEGMYSLFELQFAAMSVTAWQSATVRAENGTGGSEVRQALTVSLLSMKIEVAATRGYIGSELADTLRSVQDSASKELLDAMDRHHARQQSQQSAVSHVPNCDRALFRRVHQRVMDAFRKTGDAMGSIRVGAAMAKPELERARAEHGPAHRWDVETAPRGYWDSFYGGAYETGGFHAFEQDWAGFLERMGRPGHWEDSV